MYGLYSDLLSRSRIAATPKIPFPKLASHLQILEKTWIDRFVYIKIY